MGSNGAIIHYRYCAPCLSVITHLDYPSTLFLLNSTDATTLGIKNVFTRLLPKVVNVTWRIRTEIINEVEEKCFLEKDLNPNHSNIGQSGLLSVIVSFIILVVLVAFIIREFKKLRRPLQRNVTLKENFALG